MHASLSLSLSPSFLSPAVHLPLLTTDFISLVHLQTTESTTSNNSIKPVAHLSRHMLMQYTSIDNAVCRGDMDKMMHDTKGKTKKEE